MRWKLIGAEPKNPTQPQMVEEEDEALDALTGQMAGLSTGSNPVAADQAATPGHGRRPRKRALIVGCSYRWVLAIVSWGYWVLNYAWDDGSYSPAATLLLPLLPPPVLLPLLLPLLLLLLLLLNFGATQF